MMLWCKRHFAILTLIIALVLLVLQLFVLTAATDNLTLSLIREDGDASLAEKVGISGLIVDDTNRASLLQAFSWQQGNMKSENRLLAPGNAGQLLQEGSGSVFSALAGYNYQFNSWWQADSSRTWLAIRRYRNGGRGYQTAWIPTDLSFANALESISFRYNPWYLLAGSAGRPLTQIRDQIYGILPANENCIGTSMLFRLDNWQEDWENLPDEAVLNGGKPCYTRLADIPLDQKTSLFSLFGHDDTLLLVSARVKEKQTANDRTSIVYQDLTVTRYRLDGTIEQILTLDRTFANLSGAYLSGDTLVIETSGSEWTMDLISVADQLVYWGSVPIGADQNYNRRDYPYAAALVDGKAYLLHAAWYYPQQSGDGLNLQYDDGTSLAAKAEDLQNALALPHYNLYLSVYDHDRNLLYQADYDTGIQADYRYLMASEEPGELSGSVRRYVQLKISEVAQP